MNVQFALTQNCGETVKTRNIYTSLVASVSSEIRMSRSGCAALLIEEATKVPALKPFGGDLTPTVEQSTIEGRGTDVNPCLLFPFEEHTLASFTLVVPRCLLLLRKIEIFTKV